MRSRYQGALHPHLAQRQPLSAATFLITQKGLSYVRKTLPTAVSSLLAPPMSESTAAAQQQSAATYLDREWVSSQQQASVAHCCACQMRALVIKNEQQTASELYDYDEGFINPSIGPWASPDIGACPVEMCLGR